MKERRSEGGRKEGREGEREGRTEGKGGVHEPASTVLVEKPM